MGRKKIKDDDKMYCEMVFRNLSFILKVYDNNKLGEWMGLTGNAITQRRGTGSIPYGEIIQAALRDGISLNLIFQETELVIKEEKERQG